MLCVGDFGGRRKSRLGLDLRQPSKSLFSNALKAVRPGPRLPNSGSIGHNMIRFGHKSCSFKDLPFGLSAAWTCDNPRQRSRFQPGRWRLKSRIDCFELIGHWFFKFITSSILTICNPFTPEGKDILLFRFLCRWKSYFSFQDSTIQYRRFFLSTMSFAEVVSFLKNIRH